MRVGDEEPGVRRDQVLVRRFAMRGCHCCSRPVTALPVAEVNDPFPATFDGPGRDDLQCPLHVETSQADGILTLALRTPTKRRMSAERWFLHDHKPGPVQVAHDALCGNGGHVFGGTKMTLCPPLSALMPALSTADM
jgi:hypothetical protein